MKATSPGPHDCGVALRATVRQLPSALVDEHQKPVIRPFYAVHVDFPDPVWIWTGLGSIHFLDQEWIGIGGQDADGNPVGIGSIESIGQGTDGSATGIKLTMVGVPPEWRDHIADQAVRGVEGATYYGALNETWQEVIGYQLLERGTLDGYRVVDTGNELAIEVSLESRMIDQRRPTIKRYTDAYQQARYPGDRFFEYQAQMAEVSILWDKAAQDAVV